MFRSGPGPEADHPIDVAVHAILQEGTGEWQPLDDEDRAALRENADLRQAMAIATVGGALEMRISYTVTAIGDPRRITFCVEVCGHWDAKFKTLADKIAKGVWPSGTFAHGPGTVEAMRVTADGKTAIDEYTLGVTDGIARIQRQDAPGRVFLVSGPSVDGTLPDAEVGNTNAQKGDQSRRQRDGLQPEAKAIGVMMDILRTNNRLPTLKEIAGVLDCSDRTLRGPGYAAFHKAWEKEKAARASKPRKKAEKRK